MTYQEIGDELGITRERVRQITKELLNLFAITNIIRTKELDSDLIIYSDLSKKIVIALISKGIISFSILSNFTVDEISNLKGVGPKKIDELLRYLARKNIHLSDSSSSYKLPDINKDLLKSEINRITKHINDLNLNNSRKSRLGSESDLINKFRLYINDGFSSINEFLQINKIHNLTIAKQSYPKLYEELKEYKAKLQSKWHSDFDHCVVCRTTNSPYRSRGMCKDCYPKSELFKEAQRKSRMKNSDKWKKKQAEYNKEYLKRPEIIAHKERLRDLQLFGGNRNLALKRDLFQCTNCGLGIEQSEKFYGVSLYVTRIDGNKANNELSNLKTLCIKCHAVTFHSHRKDV